MPTYLYECQNPKHGEFEIEHSIKEKLEFCPSCKKKYKVKRLIASGGKFILLGGGWAKEGYS